MNKIYFAREYSDLIGRDLSGKLFVKWTHPDIPMWGATLLLDDNGIFKDVGKTVTEETAKAAIDIFKKVYGE